MVALKNVSKAYGALVVLRNFTFSFGKGITVISAPSAAGKTTLLRIIGGLEQPDSGQVILPSHSKVAFMFQEDRLLPHLTVYENIYEVAGGEKAEVENLLHWLGLWEFREMLPKSLSGGMERRTALGRTLAYKGDIVILDEPFKGLDREIKEKVMSNTKRLLEKKTVIMVTHDDYEGEMMADHILKADGLPFRIK